MTMDVVAYDNYFTGLATDVIADIEVAPLGERYLGVFGADSVISGDIDPFSGEKLTVVDFGFGGTNPSENGLLLVARRQPRLRSKSGAPEGNEALLIRVKQ